MSVFTQWCDLKESTCEMRLTSVRVSVVITCYISSFQILGKNTKKWISGLKILVVAVWIFKCLVLSGFICGFRSIIYECLKMGFQTVDITELHLTYLQEAVKIKIFQLIIIFQQFQVVQLIDMIILFHLICWKAYFNNFFSGALSSELSS